MPIFFDDFSQNPGVLPGRIPTTYDPANAGAWGSPPPGTLPVLPWDWEAYGFSGEGLGVADGSLKIIDPLNHYLDTLCLPLLLPFSTVSAGVVLSAGIKLPTLWNGSDINFRAEATDCNINLELGTWTENAGIEYAEDMTYFTTLDTTKTFNETLSKPNGGVYLLEYGFNATGRLFAKLDGVELFQTAENTFNPAVTGDLILTICVGYDGIRWGGWTNTQSTEYTFVKVQTLDEWQNGPPAPPPPLPPPERNVPDLFEVRYYSDKDVYHFSTDNRPLYDLSSRDDQIVDKYTPITSVTRPPQFLGQIAIVNRSAYLGVGVDSTIDWKKVT